ncbi:hypothetical protein APHAL10511_000409 [Amanita phalloides]|nr:hypothetical protein APHAL10511_000409 [Amanita phalloides]
MRERDQRYTDASDFSTVRSAREPNPRERRNRHTRDPPRSSSYEGQYRGNDLRYSATASSCAVYPPTRDYVVSPAATSSLATWRAPRMLPTGASDTDTGLRSRPRDERQSSPTPEYINATLESSIALADPTSVRKLLVLDLNGTLVFRSPHKRRDYRPRRYQSYQKQGNDIESGGTSFPHEEPFDPYANPTIQRPTRPVHLRPFLLSFKRYILHPDTSKWLDTMIWSSAQPHSVQDMVEQCFGDEKDNLVAIWARDTLGLSDEDYNRKTQTTKDLAKPWASLALSKSRLDNQNKPGTSTPSIQSPATHSAYTTILLDDSPLKAQLQPWNHVCIKEYVAEMHAADIRAAQFLKLPQLQITEETENLIDVTFAGETKRTSTDKDNESDVEAEAIVNEGSEGTEQGQAMEHIPRKRKRPHRKKLARQLQKQVTLSMAMDKRQEGWVGEDAPAYHWWKKFDCTLLAVVGVLDAVKRESNVAAWVKRGGLWRSENAEELGMPRSAGILKRVSEDSASAQCLGPAELESGIAGVNASDQKRPKWELAGNSSDKVKAEDGLVRKGLWFDDELTMDYWVARGVKALRELQIEIDACIRVS